MKKRYIGHKLGLAMAGALLFCTAIVRGQDAPAPTIMPAVDATTLDRAITNGNLLLEQITWRVKIHANVNDMRIVGPTLVCSVYSNTTALDTKTGTIKWEANQAVQAPISWKEKSVVNVGFDVGQLKLIRWSADTPRDEAVWETRFAPPWETGRDTHKEPILGTDAIFADQQIIAGEHLEMLQQGQAPAASLTIRSFDVKTGKALWATAVPGLTTSAQVRVAKGKVYVLVSCQRIASAPAATARPGFVMCLNAADGKLQWQTEMGVASHDAAAEGTMLVTLGENSAVTAYDVRTGKQQWRTTLSKECDPTKSEIGVLGRGNVFLNDGRVIAALTPSGTLNFSSIARLDLASGRQTGFFDAKGLNMLPGKLLLHNETLIAQVLQNRCVGINLRTLNLDWEIPAWASTVEGDMLYGANTPEINGSRVPPAEVFAIPLNAPRQRVPADLP